MIRLMESPAAFPLPPHPYLAPLMETEIACYGGDSRLLLWLQKGAGGQAVAHIARLGTYAAVFASPNADFAELGDFLDRVGWFTTETVPAMSPVLTGCQEISTLLTLEGPPVIPPGSGLVPLTAGQLFPVVSACFNGFGDDRGAWMVHFSLLLRRGRAKAWGCLKGGRIVSAGAITHMGGGRAILGYICTLPGWCGKGLASQMTAFLAEECRKMGLVPVLASSKEHEGLYRACGFTPWGCLLTVVAPGQE